jgi:hypothetical protein
MTSKLRPSQTRLLVWLGVAVLAAAFAAGLAAPLIRTGCTPPAQRPPAAWTIAELRDHLARGLPLELHPVRTIGPQVSPAREQARLVRPGVAADYGAGVVMVTKAVGGEDTAGWRRMAEAHPTHALAWGPFLIEGDTQLLAEIRYRLPRA